jgi:hypothetical protein
METGRRDGLGRPGKAGPEQNKKDTIEASMLLKTQAVKPGQAKRS